MTFTRRSLLGAGLALGAAASFGGCTRRDRLEVKRIAITMDDFRLSEGLPLSPAQRNDNILRAFSDHNIQALGFVTGSFVESDLGHSVLQSWADAGHIIGNHTWSHPHASDISAEEFFQEVIKNQSFISKYSTAQKLLRFPFLDEGNTAEHRDALRNWLNENDYLNIPVTVDSFDWLISQRLEKRLRDNPAADVSGYRDYYLESSLKAAEYAHALAGDLGFPTMPHTFLCHHNELNGLFMGELLAHFKSNGWEPVNAQIAVDHPALQIQPAALNRQGTLLRVLEAEAIRIADQEDLKPRINPIDQDFGKAAMIERGL